MSVQARVAWWLVAVTVVLGGVHTGLFFGWSSLRETSTGWPILTVGSVLMAALGALIVTRIAGHRIGWLFVAGGVSLALGITLDSYAQLLLEGNTAPGWVELPLAWTVTLLDLAVPATVLTLTFLLFPDGRLPSLRWRPLLWAVIATLVLFVLVVVANVRAVDLYQETTPESMPAYAPVVYGILVIVLLLEVLVTAVSVFVRLRRAEGDERQQLLWVCSAAFFVAIGLAVAIGVEALGLEDVVDDRLRTLPLHLAVVAIPVAAGLAILRYRLYDIDVVLNRAIVLTALTAFVAMGYVAVVVAIGAVVGSQARERFWPSLLATATVALAFQPVRRAVLRFADRLVYGRRAAPYEALAEFSAELVREEPPAAITARLADGIGRTVGARQVKIALALPGLADAGATWPRASQRSPGGEETRVAIADGGDEVGRIELLTDGPLTTEERYLVQNLGRQAGVALRNAHLEAELAARVSELTVQADELAGARRDLLTARDQERARLAGAIDQRVVTHLATLPTELDGLAGRVRDAPAETEQTLGRELDAVVTALEELRRLTRGLVAGRGTTTTTN